MPQVLKKENLVISIREYQDNQGQTKKVWKQIGEMVSWQGDDGSTFQTFEMWGPTGSTKGKVFDQQDSNSQASQAPQQQAPAAPYGQAPQQQAPQQAPYNGGQQGNFHQGQAPR